MISLSPTVTPAFKPLTGLPSAGNTLQPIGAPQFQGAEVQTLPQFQGATMGHIFSPALVQQLSVDTGNVLVPKLPFIRSKAQLFEEVFLELVEDLWMYITIPLVSPLLAKTFIKRFGVTQDAVGTRLGNKVAQASRELVATKAGVILGAVAIASTLNYMVQPVRNAITAKVFAIKNFTAVAGLEENRVTLKEGERDPVNKLKKRTWQVATLGLATTATALLAPRLLLKNEMLLNQARKMVKYIDFDSSQTTFGLSRAMLALVIGAGVTSYLDSSRDSLERKETATRLAFVVPGLLFGKALGNDLLAWGFERFGKVGFGDQKQTIKKHLEGTGLSFINGNPLKKAINADTFMDFDVMTDKKKLFEALKKTNLSSDVQLGIVEKFARIGFPWSYLASALIFGSGVCWLAFRQTKKRYEEQQAQQGGLPNQAKTDQNKPQPPQQPPFSGPTPTPFAAFNMNQPFVSTPAPASVYPSNNLVPSVYNYNANFNAQA